MACLVSMAAALAFAGGDMRVEEPDNVSVPPIDPDAEGGQWHAGNHVPSQADRASIQERRKRVAELAAKIREQREALEQSTGEDRERMSQELKDLILDGDKELNKREKLTEKRAEKKEEIRQRQLEKKKEKEETPHPPKGKGNDKP